MAGVLKGRYMADVSRLGDEVVVFVIGMRINKPLKVGLWWPVFNGMGKMLKYLAERPEKGCSRIACRRFPRSSCSIGGLLMTWSGLPATMTTLTWSHGGDSIGRSVSPATSESGMRRTE